VYAPPFPPYMLYATPISCYLCLQFVNNLLIIYKADYICFFSLITLNNK
jgi:hypothetical protein